MEGSCYYACSVTPGRRVVPLIKKLPLAHLPNKSGTQTSHERDNTKTFDPVLTTGSTYMHEKHSGHQGPRFVLGKGMCSCPGHSMILLFLFIITRFF